MNCNRIFDLKKRIECLKAKAMADSIANVSAQTGIPAAAIVKSVATNTPIPPAIIIKAQAEKAAAATAAADPITGMPQSSLTGNAQAAVVAPPSTTNMKTIAIIGGGVLLLGLMVILILKKKS